MSQPESDLLTSLLEAILGKVFEEAVKHKQLGETVNKETVETLVNGCLINYNVKSFLNYGLKELRKDNAKIEFPPVIVDYYNVRDAVTDSWKVTRPGMEGMSTPEIAMEPATIQTSMEDLSYPAKVQPVLDPSWKSASAFQLNVREVVDKCVKWSISNLPFHKSIVCERPNCGKSWNVEICLCYSESYSTEPDTSGQVDSTKILLAKMLTKILTTLGYSVVGGGKTFTAIPSSVMFPNVLIAFSNSESGERILVEKDPVDFYTKYSGGVVILYNYARLKSILDKYDSLIKSEDYPPLPPLDNVDFSQLGECKEEVAVIFMLFLWPRALSNVVNLGRNSADKVNTSFLFDFVKTFAKTFDEYYNHVMVIVPKTTPHNFATMTARIWLLRAVGKVFEQFMDLAAMEVERISED